MTYAEDDYLQLSGIQHYCYCKRQWGLINLEQVWLEDARTVAGHIMHKNVDTPSNKTKGGVRSISALRVASSALGLSGICDIVEFHYVNSKCGVDFVPCLIHPVEYKVGHRKIHDCDKIQLCAQAIALEEMYGIPVSEGSLYYGQERRRMIVQFDEPLRIRVHELADGMHRMFDSGEMPSAILSESCKKCSLFNHCMPLDVALDVNQYIDECLRR